MTFKKLFLFAQATLLLTCLLVGCSPSAVTATATDVPDDAASCNVNPVSSEPELYGLWVMENADQRNILTVTENSLYLVEYSGNESGDSIRETFYEIESADWENNMLTMKISWIRVNGAYGGFGSPSKLLKFSLEDNSLYFSIGDESAGLPADTTNGPWVEK